MHTHYELHTYYRAHDNGRTWDILRTFTLISGQLVTWPVRYASIKNIATTKPGLSLIKFFCDSEVAMKPYCK